MTTVMIKDKDNDFLNILLIGSPYYNIMYLFFSSDLSITEKKSIFSDFCKLKISYNDKEIFLRGRNNIYRQKTLLETSYFMILFI